MQLKNSNIDNSKTRMGSVLPREISKTTIVCKDSVLKEQVEMLIHVMNMKLMPDAKLLNATGKIINIKVLDGYRRDWTNKDYQEFRKQLSSVTIPLFQENYLNFLYYLKFSKIKLEKKLKYIDEVLGLQFFLDDRILKKYKETVKKEDGTEEVVAKEKYLYVPHVFTMADLPRFFQVLNSRIASYNNNVLKTYELKQDKNKSLDEQIEDLKLLIEMIDKRDPEVISLIEKPYLEWISKLPKNNYMYLHLEKMITTIIENSKLNLKHKLADLEQEKNNVYRFYIMGRKTEFHDMKAKKRKEIEGYKFG